MVNHNTHFQSRNYVSAVILLLMGSLAPMKLKLTLLLFIDIQVMPDSPTCHTDMYVFEIPQQQDV